MPTATETDERAVATRKLVLRDSLAFLGLTLVTVVLFAVTLFLFRSFSARRDDLAHRWSDRGAKALAAHQPEQAIGALRTALIYAPGTRAYELLLAQALGEAGHTEESYNYFLSLAAAQPGNGFINLELARLAAQRNQPEAAVNFYRASVYGTWEGDGVTRRASVRLELARYLIATHQLAAARIEILIISGNLPETAALDLQLADLLTQADSPTDAIAFYNKSLALQPNNPHAIEAIARLTPPPPPEDDTTPTPTRHAKKRHPQAKP